jgi:hypothetical protein
MSVRPWIGASFGYASLDSLGMSWLPLSRFGSRVVCVAVSCCREPGGRRCHTQYPLGVGYTHVDEAVDWRIARVC